MPNAAARTEVPQAVSPPPPPFDPDPALIDHLEGNRLARRSYQRFALKLRDKARSGQDLDV
jgi:uncharacterized protein involved in outer membrane biogenesis